MIVDSAVKSSACLSVCREDRARLAADMKSFKAAHDKALLEARTKYVTADLDRPHTETSAGLTAEDVDKQTAAEAGDWVEVEKRVSSAGCVDIAAVSATEVELKRRVDKLSSMITEVSYLWCFHYIRRLSDYLLDWAPSSLSLVDLAVVCIT